MAKLKGPLLSLGASQKLGDAIVFFPWKGINAVRTWVVPANPQTTDQQTQRGYMTFAVARVHLAMQHATHPLTAADKTAFALWGTTFANPRTWFNQLVKNLIDSLVAAGACPLLTSGTTTPGAGQLSVGLWQLFASTTAGSFFYGKTKHCTEGKVAASYAGDNMTATITGLTAGIKYYWQFVPSAPANMTLIRSGVYSGTPT